MLRFLGIRPASGATLSASEGDEEGRYLLSFGLLASPGASMCLCIQVWDVEATGEGAEKGTRLAGEWIERGRVIGLAVDEGDGMREPVPGADFRDAKGTLVAVSARCSQMCVAHLLWELSFLTLCLSNGVQSRGRSHIYPSCSALHFVAFAFGLDFWLLRSQIICPSWACKRTSATWQTCRATSTCGRRRPRAWNPKGRRLGAKHYDFHRKCTRRLGHRRWWFCQRGRSCG